MKDSSFKLSDGWTVKFHLLPSHDHKQEHTDDDGNDNSSVRTVEGVILVSIPLSTLYVQNDAYQAFVPPPSCSNDDKLKSKAAKIALADYTARQLSTLLPLHNNNGNHGSSNYTVQTMGQTKHANVNIDKQRRFFRRTKKLMIGKKKEVTIPYVLERSDCTIVCEPEDVTVLQFYLHVTLSSYNGSSIDDIDASSLEQLSSAVLQKLQSQLKSKLTSNECYIHVACVVLQNVLRDMLQLPKKKEEGGSNSCTTTDANNGNDHEKSCSSSSSREYLDAVAFIADNSLLPRKSGRSELPMKSPPAIPFCSPENSDQLTRVVTVNVGTFWRRYLEDDGSVKQRIVEKEGTVDEEEDNSEPSTVSMRGMIIPRGVTLIVGGGYHGKSTILQAITMGIYDTIPYDGRERCVTHIDANIIRAEDGRYVHSTNVSAFISNLPSGKSINGASIAINQDTTTQFSTKDASGSTSQAANVIEAIECGASSLLVDEDISAANFMARDGRMRAMIMDEPITPLLYRVNGLYLCKEHEISTVVVVGGVGEWLDVADAVVLMKDYLAYDGLAKARSVSYQFSYNHVQYAGRGVVHRLPWEVKEETNLKMDYFDDGISEEVDEKSNSSAVTTTLSPLRRRPELNCIMNKFKNAAVHLLDSGSSRLWFYSDGDDECANNAATGNNDDEDDGMVDMSKSSQLVGNASEQLYGCGICVLWLIQASLRHSDEDLSELLDRMEQVLDNENSCSGGMNGLLASLKQSKADSITSLLSDSNHDILDMWETVGYVYRPRRHEVAMTLTRMRGMKFQILPEKVKVSPEEERKQLEEESKKRALAELWANRRKK